MYEAIKKYEINHYLKKVFASTVSSSIVKKNYLSRKMGKMKKILRVQL